MADGTMFVGLDVHVETITLATIDEAGKTTPAVRFPNTPDQLAKQLRKRGARERLRVCYEAGPSGYVIYRQLSRIGIACSVVAPSLIPVRPGDRVKTDRRDAEKLARLLRGGELTMVAVPSPEIEAVRDLSREREHAVGELHRHRQHLLSFLLRHGAVPPAKTGRYTKRWWSWVEGLTFATPVERLLRTELREAIQGAERRLERLTAMVEELVETGPFGELATDLQQLHGIGPISAIGVLAEVGDLGRFAKARQLMAYAGLVPGEDTSGGQTHRGHITKTGNRHLRRLVVEASWHATRRPAPPLPASADRVTRIAHAAHDRCYRRYARLLYLHKSKQVAIVAVARELLGFIWAIAHPEGDRPQVVLG